MGHPSPNSKEQWTIAEVLAYVKAALADDIEKAEAGVEQEVVIDYVGANRVEVFRHLIEHGWAMTSVNHGTRSTSVWLEPLAN